MNFFCLYVSYFILPFNNLKYFVWQQKLVLVNSVALIINHTGGGGTASLLGAGAWPPVPIAGYDPEYWNLREIMHAGENTLERASRGYKYIKSVKTE